MKTLTTPTWDPEESPTARATATVEYDPPDWLDDGNLGIREVLGNAVPDSASMSPFTIDHGEDAGKYYYKVFMDGEAYWSQKVIWDGSKYRVKLSSWKELPDRDGTTGGEDPADTGDGSGDDGAGTGGDTGGTGGDDGGTGSDSGTGSGDGSSTASGSAGLVKRIREFIDQIGRTRAFLLAGAAALVVGVV